MATGYGKIVMFFGGGKWGWNEEFFWTSENASLAALLADAKALCGARRALLSTSFSLEAVRVSICDSAGNTFLNKQNLISYAVNGNLGTGLFAGACTNPWLALLEHCSDTNAQYSRNLILRGIPSAFLCQTNTTVVPFPIPDELSGRLKEFNDFLIGRAGQQVGSLRMRVKDVLNRQNAVNIVDVQRLDNGHWQIMTNGLVPIYNGGAAPTNAGLGSVVHVYAPRKTWARGLSGDHRVINPYDPGEANVLTLSGCQARACTIDYLQDAVVSGVGYVLVPIARVDPSRPINKSTGGPFFGTRGRASKKVCC